MLAMGGGRTENLMDSRRPSLTGSALPSSRRASMDASRSQGRRSIEISRMAVGAPSPAAAAAAAAAALVERSGGSGSSGSGRRRSIEAGRNGSPNISQRRSIEAPRVLVQEVARNLIQSNEQSPREDSRNGKRVPSPPQMPPCRGPADVSTAFVSSQEPFAPCLHRH